MNTKPIYIIGSVILVLVLVMVIGGNLGSNQEEQSTKMYRSSFSSKDKKAGGAYAAFKMLPQLFYKHSIQVVTKPFVRTYEKDAEMKKAGNTYILVADQMYTTEKDVDAMLEYVSGGNDLFIAVNNPDPYLAKQLNLKVDGGGKEQFFKERIAQYYQDTIVPIDTSFAYEGMISGGSFSAVDSTTTTILGSNGQHKPNFVRIAYSNGYVYLLLNPYTFTNYFLLHKRNVAALETQISYLPDLRGSVYWDDFYNAQHSAQSGDFSEWQVLMRYPAMRWALWLGVALLLVYVIFESKRRQRIIPDKPVFNNTSVEFVGAIGQLYYQQHNNDNLAHKMILHLLEYIRTRYYLDTNILNEEFVAALSRKSAVAEADIRTLLQMMHHVQIEGNISDDYLREFYKRIQLFYLNTK
ncbi:MAG: DUF4350 domain-containing protein [Chitinophaga sp.]|uniref:DUF4350 domain-containing protein n=1 Tax=Chitinophaga sp. TaxID=1869181 RepID=UPI001B232947|nr:DUF4350 domain-containing protein [Chitinophaga sp.]MBO9727834.1 DUF4350 domain-containing protein [Chitinophaga sp.]